MSVAIWWIRRDLRLNHNPALQAALAGGRGVLPVFILDPALLSKTAEKRQAFLFGGLAALDEELRRRGSRLILQRGEPATVLQQLAAESGAAVITAEEDVSPYARRRDAAVARVLPLELVSGATVFPAGLVRKPDGNPYTVFTPFSRAWKALPLGEWQPAPAPEHFAPAGVELFSEPLPAFEALAGFPPGEAEAQRRLRAFVEDRIHAYHEDRNRLDVEGTSALSPYLRFGMISARQAAAEALTAMRSAPDGQARQGAEIWLNELIWREFYAAILYHFPHVLQTAFRAGLRTIPWRDAPEELAAWQEGRSGVPVVDAGMRQLLATGWMHNRARMITASYLVKDLLINWQDGERWFMRHLVDGDPASNNGGWQWTAGVGTDAAPYFRIFNPVTQGAKFDPTGEYIRRWVPELARVPLEYLQEPWKMPPGVQAAAGCRIGVDYPAPLVDHAAARERTLAAYRGNS